MKHLEKIVLVGAVAVCAAAGAFYGLNCQNATAVVPVNAGATPKGAEYKWIEIPERAHGADSWKDPVYDDEDRWVYDLFTPVESVWKSEEQAYKPKYDGPPPPPFGLKLVSVGHPEYRLRLVGYIQLPGLPIANARLSFVDYEKNDDNGKPGFTFTASKGKPVEGENIEIKDFFIDTVKDDESGTIAKTPTAIIIDKSRPKGAQELKVTDKPIVFKEVTNVVIARADDPSKTWTLHKVGDQIKEDDSANYLGTFTLKDIDINGGSVTLEKLYKPNLRRTASKMETQTLSVEREPAKPVPAKEGSESIAQ